MISSLVTNNWITIVLIVMIGLLVLANFLFEKQFSKFTALFQSKQYFVAYISITSLFHPFNIIFALFQAFCYGLIAQKTLLYYNSNLVNNSFLSFLKIVILILLFYFIRHVLGVVLARIFKLKKEQLGVSFVKLSYLSKVALTVFPLLIITSYIPYKNELLFVILGVFTTVLLLIKYLNILQLNQKLIFGHLFYFILYLCTLEILPLMLIIKTLSVKF